MGDALAVTARSMISEAEQERDLALGQARLLEGQLQRAKEDIAALQSELRPTGTPDVQRREFSDRVMAYVWRSACNAVHDDDPPDEIGRLTDWLEYRLEQWIDKQR